ncbi:hypothetical protein Anapl_08050 [Anas platyrhynchos]|uniref:Uncharacterized protein n=1 Tax=Anas platyrhynchos TaxID=8839 RepID=R0KG73_ANAPL|nr:hypothetical protein Anapl_08050 [Anas platyrhynchos]
MKAFRQDIVHLAGGLPVQALMHYSLALISDMVALRKDAQCSQVELIADSLARVVLCLHSQAVLFTSQGTSEESFEGLQKSGIAILQRLSHKCGDEAQKHYTDTSLKSWQAISGSRDYGLSGFYGALINLCSNTFRGEQVDKISGSRGMQQLVLTNHIQQALLPTAVPSSQQNPGGLDPDNTSISETFKAGNGHYTADCVKPETERSQITSDFYSAKHGFEISNDQAVGSIVDRCCRQCLVQCSGNLPFSTPGPFSFYDDNGQTPACKMHVAHKLLQCDSLAGYPVLVLLPKMQEKHLAGTTNACRSSGLRTQEQGRIWYFRGEMCNRRKGGKLMRLKHCFGKALSEEDLPIRQTAVTPEQCEHMSLGAMRLSVVV